MDTIVVGTTTGTCLLSKDGYEFIRGNIPHQPKAIVWHGAPYAYAEYSEHPVPASLKEHFDIPSNYRLWLLEKPAEGRPEFEGPDPHAMYMVHTGVAWD